MRLTAFLFLLLTGCAGSRVVPPTLGSNDDIQCQSPSGRFDNIGQMIGDSDNFVPRLSALVFDGELAGFGVSHLEFATDSEEQLTIRAWVNDTLLNEVRVISPDDKRCSNGRWRITTSWDALILEGAVAGLLWTGGIFIPAAQREEYEFAFSETSDLLVRHRDRTAGTYFFFFPMYSSTDEFWVRYPRLQTETDLIPTSVQD